MNKIRLLEKNTADQIAAGEVAERPTLVIKELIENSMDAGATEIRIVLKESGIQQIRVTDNGYGIVRNELRLAFARHATSKLSAIDDLSTLATMGFRGEALASVGAVAKVRLTTKTDDEEQGYGCSVEGGSFSEIPVAAVNRGCDICVDDLFYNTPARRQFLASPAAELREICNLVGRLIISAPQIAIALSNNGRKIFQSTGNGKMCDAILSVYGSELTRHLLMLDSDRFIGYISHPSYTKPTRSYYHFYLNGRTIKNDDLNHCLEDAYHTLIPERRFPVVFIDIHMDPSQYDVNVHPNKLAVKFRRGSNLTTELGEVLRKTLNSAERFYETHEKRSSDLHLAAPPAEILSKPLKLEQQSFPQFAVQRYCCEHETKKTDSGGDVAQTTTSVSGEQLLIPVEQAPAAEQNITASTVEILTPMPDPSPASFYRELTIIGQWAGTFILAADDDALYIIDQHAAHERLLYSRIRASLSSQQIERETLLVPLELHLNFRQYGWLLENIIILRDLGFVLEDFGDGALLVREVPDWASSLEIETFLMDFADGWLARGDKLRREHILDHGLMTRACKRAVKANQHLTNSDIRYLFDQLANTEDNFTCPHGRPISLRYTMAEIRHRFLRS